MSSPKPNNTLDNNKTNWLEFIETYAFIGTWEFNLKTNSLYWSEETKKIHEVDQNYVPNVEVGINFYKEGLSRDTIATLFTNCIEKLESFDVELEIITHKGNEKWVRAIGKPILEHDVCVKVQGLFQDIDEKTKISKALEINEYELRTTFENALVGMASISLSGKWLDVNKSLCKTFGYSKEEFLKLTFMDITHPDDQETAKNATIDLLKGKIDHYEAEIRYISKKGETIWAKLSAVTIKNSQGEPQYFVSQIFDLTKIKKSSNRVNELLKTTESQNDRLLNFTHIVSHNLRSHYSNLDMLLNIMKMEMPENTDNEVFPLLQQAVKHLGETVVNLNEVAAINIKKDITLKPINLLDALNNVFSSISAIQLNSKTNITTDVSSSINIMGIKAYVESILLNFLTNAIKYKKPNEQARIEIKAYTNNDLVVLKVKDYGLGIDLKLHGKKLFGMYKTFHVHEDARGLGLFISKNQLEAIGGSIDVESEVNKGTTFYLKFKKNEEN